jgi:hypothetical protein
VRNQLLIDGAFAESADSPFPLDMKQNYTPLMALALAGILTPAAEAVIYSESTDYSNTGGSPTLLGAFDPTADGILGTVSNSDFTDAMLVTATPGASVTMNYSITGPAFPFFGISIYDNAGFATFLGGQTLNPSSGSGSDSFSFTVPGDGNYMIALNHEASGTISYTIGVPEPTSTALLGAIALGAAAVRRRKSASLNA